MAKQPAKTAVKKAAKKAAKKREVVRRVADVWEVHVAECPECSEELLLTIGDISMGDHFDCPRCRTALQVGQQCRDIYKGERPAKLVARSL